MTMSDRLKVSTGQHSDKGRKEINQDFHGIRIPQQPQLGWKGIAVALADGISSSDVSQVASQSAVAAFLEDYYCTSEAWSVKTSAERVLSATNSWLHTQTMQSQGRYDKDRGYVCTLSAMVIKSATAHIFHVGDARIYRLRGNVLEQLTSDHRVWVSRERSYLGRALGVNARVEIDYQALPVEQGDLFVLATDGVYEHASAGCLTDAINASPDDLGQAARRIVEKAYRQGSEDNLTVQLIRIDALARPQLDEIYQKLSGLALPPLLEARMRFDGYRIIRELHASNRSHVYLAEDGETGARVALKTPSIDLAGDAACLERFLMEEWIARRIHSAHVLKPWSPARKPGYLYSVMEFVDGQTLTRWMNEHSRPDVEAVRGIVEQIARGLRAFHRLEMLHQDLRPDNIMMDSAGTVKIIDFGSASIAGMMEIAPPAGQNSVLGTAQYAAPEYFLGEGGSARSDLFSLGVIAYQMLTGKLPYGTEVAKSRSRAAQRKLKYISALDDDREIPAWIDEALRKAVHPDPRKRYAELSEFVFDLHYPNKAFLSKPRPPLMERNPVLFWKGVSFVLALMLVMALCVRSAAR